MQIFKQEGKAMRYELISKEVLDEVCQSILRAKGLLNTVTCKETIIQMDQAYLTIMKNRTQCNVRPESEE